MTYRGIVRGNTIELENKLGLAEGTRVTVDLFPDSKPHRSSPQAVLRLAGTLSEAEAETILQGAQFVRAFRHQP